MKQKGFTIIELLISLAVGYFLITVLMAALWVVYSRLSSVREYNAAYATVSVAHDIMVRDVQGIACERSVCKKIAPEALIWPLGNGTDRGYEVVEGTVLKRIEGHYDAKTNRWHDAVRSTVLNGVNSCRFEVEGSASLINAVKISLSIGRQPAEINDTFVVAPRNRQIG